MHRELVPHEDEVERSGRLDQELLHRLRARAIQAGLYAANMPEEVGGGGLDTLTWMLMEGTQLTVGEPVWKQPVDEQGLQQGVHPDIAEAQPGDPGAGVGDDRRGQLGEGLGAADRVVADALDAEQAPVGGEADLPQCGQVGQPFR